jgi:hypothetical protein
MASPGAASQLVDPIKVERLVIVAVLKLRGGNPHLSQLADPC